MKKYIVLALALVCLVSTVFLYQAKRKNSSKNTDLTIIGRIKMADGIGRQSVEVIKALYDDIDMSFVKTERVDLTDVPKNVQAVLRNKQKYAPVILFEEVLWYPGVNHYKKIFGIDSKKHIKIAYSMYESTRIPETWVSILNSYFDAVAVPDKFLVGVYKDSGVTIPVFDVPLTIDLSKVLSQDIKTKKNTPFVFANFSTCDHRKNHLTLVQAFAKAFGDRKDVVLKISYRWGNPEIIAEMRKEVTEKGLTNIHFYNIEHDTEHYINNFKKVDCYVSLSKGEGFSIQPREAMALGIPTIATNNTAQTTLCESGLVKVVESNIPEQAYFLDGEPIGNFFNCSVDDAAEALIDVYENYDKYLKNSEAGRKWAAQYDTTVLKPLYLNLVKPKKVILGEEDKVTEEYLMTTSKELYEKYKKLVR